MKKHQMQPESLMMTYGYRPELSEGAVKAPIFQTSTFVFQSAEEGKAFFELTYGLRDKSEDEELGLIYSRINNPNLEILEDRLCLWDQAEECAVFESGMSAISTVLLEFLAPGDVLLYSAPTYGGTNHFINHFLSKIGVESMPFFPWQSQEEILQGLYKSGKASRLKFIYLESPANPTNDLFDFSVCRSIADHFLQKEQEVFVGVDNTYMGPLWSQPLQHGADLVMYSATKYLGGHSDLIAGAVLGNKTLMKRVKTLRTFLGNMASPHTGWLLLRSLETLKLRMEQQMRNAQVLANFLNQHPKIEKVYYLGLIPEDTKAHTIYQRQYTSPGAMLSFDVKGGEQQAFQLLNALQLVKLAVSLGSTESLAQHPATMTHVGVCPEMRARIGISQQMVRLSVGVENSQDLVWDLEQALDKVHLPAAVLA